jgi:GT2 family glycosyltransferase
MRLTPVSGLQPVDERRGEWLATDPDPQFDVFIGPGMRGQWVRLQFEIEPQGGWASCPVLYLDCGRGYLHHGAVRLPRPAPGRTAVEFIFPLPEGLVRARLRPLAQAGRFRLAGLSLQPLSKPMAGLAMAASVIKADGIRSCIATAARSLLPLPTTRRLRQFLQWVVGRYRTQEGAQAYSDWIAHFEPRVEEHEALRAEQAAWRNRPLISVVMPVYNTPAALLRAAIESVRVQVYPHWELCIADDASTQSHVRKVLEEVAAGDSRIKIAWRPHNGHISAASNSALDLATGEFVALLDHDDLLHPLALHFMADAIERHPQAGLLYSDEDKIDATGLRFDPYFKCDFNYELLLAQNMISHLGVYRRSLLVELGGFRTGLEGSQDYDLALRVIERLAPRQIVHVPRVLYHWRATAGSTALSGDEKPYAVEAARSAIREHLARSGVHAEVSAAPEAPDHHRVRFRLPSPAPKVSIIIPTRDRADLLGACIDSIAARSTYADYEIIVVDNGSEQEATHSLFERLRAKGVSVLPDASPFNFSRLNNLGVAQAKGSFICLMNNDIEIITPDWLEEMVSFAARDGVGAVGARLWYPDGALQHGGVILGADGVARHAHQFLRKGQAGYFGRGVLHQAFSAVTAACLVVRTDAYRAVGGLDEALPVAFNDVDFCLRLQRTGLRNLWTPYAQMIHHESASRGEDLSPSKRARLLEEARLMEDRWKDVIARDPAFNPNLTLVGDSFGLAWPPRTH